MLAEIKKEYSEIKTDNKSIRNFGVVFFLVLSAIGVWLIFKQGSSNLIFISLGMLFLILGVLLPKALMPFYKIWMIFGIIMGWIVSRVVLMFLFYLVFTPINLILKIMGKDILDKKIEKEKDSYWNAFEEPDNTEHYKNQF